MRENALVDFTLKRKKKQKIVLQKPIRCGKISVTIKLYEFGKCFHDRESLAYFSKDDGSSSQKVGRHFNRKETQIARREREPKMANVRDAANYLVRLYYYGNRNCTSAVLQKLLIIAQLKHLYLHDAPLFEDDLFVKPSCFSIKIISTTYPDIIFDEETRTDLIDVFQAEEWIDIPKADCASLPDLSSFYDIFEDLSQKETDIISQTYSYFGKFSGKCLGEFMRNLELHKSRTVFDSVTIQEIQEYIRKIPAEDTNNNIIKFILQK